MKQLSLLSVILFSISLISAQEITAKKGSFGVDDIDKIIVWHQSDLTSVSGKIEAVIFDKKFQFKQAEEGLDYSKSYTVSNGDDYTLYISKLPVINISVDDKSLNNNKKIAGHFTYFDNNKYLEHAIGIRYRGNLSLSFPKKSLDLEFWNDATLQESIDVQFGDMRNDDDWILDAMYNEPLRLRSYVATNLWTEIHKPYYADKAPKAKSGFDVNYVEVFKNNQYWGLYQLSESVDRKQLQLKKNEEKAIFGELFKANSYNGGPDFEKAPEYENLFPHWNGWKTEYPIIDYKSDFKRLYELEKLVVKDADEDFKNSISQAIYIPNVIDYYLFVNVIRASDNLGKNYYLAKYDVHEPFFFVIWDVDGVFGIIQDGKRISLSKDVLTNGLFDRLLDLNPEDYITKVKSRWKALRTNAFSEKSLSKQIDVIYQTFTKENIYEREQRVWQNKLTETTNDDHYQFLKEWLAFRLTFLDSYFNNL